jgi:hypothetical protein
MERLIRTQVEVNALPTYFSFSKYLHLSLSVNDPLILQAYAGGNQLYHGNIIVDIYVYVAIRVIRIHHCQSVTPLTEAKT